MGVMVFASKILTVIGVIILCVYLYPHLNPHNIGEFAEENNTAAPVIFISIIALRPVLFFLPSLGLTIVAGVLFGTVWGTVYVVIGGTLSTLVGFYFARWIGRDTAKKLVEKNSFLKKMENLAKKHGKNAVLYMRLFNLPWDLVSYWAGLSGIRFKDFYIASMIPIVPISFLYTYFGSHVFSPTSAGFIISLSIMLIMGAIPYIKTRLKEKANG